MKVYTSAQTAKIFNVTTRTLERWRSSGKFVPESRTVGGHSRYSEEQIDAILNHGKKVVERTEKPVEEVNVDNLLD